MGQRRRKMKQKKHIDADWAGLPDNILEVIFERLNLMDCMSISDVCKSWRRVVAQELSDCQGHGFPWLLMSGEKDKRVRTCISILQEQEWEMLLPEAYGRYCWGSYQEWLILVRDLGSYKLDIGLFNPFTRKQVDLPGEWNLNHKMVLSGPPSLENCIFMLIQSDSQTLAFWVPGAQSWLQHKLDGEPFVDGVFSNGSFYLIGNDYNICEIKGANIFAAIKRDDASAPVAFHIERHYHEVTMPDEHENNGVLKYLVESCGELLLVCRFYSTKPDAVLVTHYFEVYSLDFSRMSWKRVESLGDQILFLGKCCSRSVSSSGLGLNVTDRIYFSNDHAVPWWNEWDSEHLVGILNRLGLDNSGTKDWGIFSLGNKNHETLSIQFRGNRDRWGPVWFTAPQWWCCKNFTLT
ncbi:PREDICTED: F-box protein At3g56470-like isoform 2 [Fragaria vesca subsp. vesca]|uniref:putative F-box protein At5g66830 n=1 Tax=Fragaria vesca subsp. vesca TaxID=101020 RepID=UPI0002C36A64|nr:PREDICTED: putative F-box protein At5g66830 [Fragaria vesca subsp. vesca]XP_011461781.1 PREDICTED: putative F-box protein At5g66830 [Fragaria vesca subsp. vesca]XP_011461782.1 PREDICTED: putative F-box protein At5g66830 [Fragaria vesca subsp. vesca]